MNRVWPKNTSAQVALTLLIWLFVAGILRILHNPYGLEIDGAEQSYLSQWFQLGSGIQPPLPTWLYHFLFELFGYSVATVQFVRLTAVGFIYWGLFRLGQLLLKDKLLSLLALLATAFMFQFSSTMLRQMHTVYVTLATIYTWIALLHIIETRKTKHYLALGFWVGIGLLSKYNFVLHLGTLFGLSLWFSAWRKPLFRPPLLLSVALALLICSPHYVWLLQHLGEVQTGVTDDMNKFDQSSLWQDYLLGFTTLGAAYLAFLAPVMVVLLGFFGKTIRQNIHGVSDTPFRVMRYYFAAIAGLLVLILLLTRSTSFHEHWLQPFYLIVPIWVFYTLRDNKTALQKPFLRFKWLCLTALLIVSINYSAKSFVRLYSGHPNSVFNVPYLGFGNALTEIDQGEPYILFNDLRTAGHLRLHFPEKKALVLHDLEHLALESEGLRKHPQVLYLWKRTEKDFSFRTKELEAAIGAKVEVNVLDSAHHRAFYLYQTEKPYNFGVARLEITLE